MRSEKMYIDGQWVDSENDETTTVYNPYNGEKIGTVPSATEADVKRAVQAAAESFESWAELPATERAGFLKKWSGLVLKHQEEIAETLTSEQGKPLAEAKGEVAGAAKSLEWNAEEAVRIYGEVIPASSKNKRIIVIKQPIGVVGAITPWNFPASMITRKIGPALAAGCTIILKPAGQTPMTAIKMVELAHEAGIPKGVINLVTGESKIISQVFMSDERIRKITFTGSTEIGKLLMEQAAETLKSISLELGGHAPLLVFEDADMGKVMAGVKSAKLRNAGQMCVAGNRFFVHKNRYEEFSEELKKLVKEEKMGNGMDPDVTIGPLIDKDAYEKVGEHVKDAVDKGAKAVMGGKGQHDGGDDAGYFYEPTILLDVTDDMIIMHEETFGPVLPVQPFTSDEEAVRKANESNYGLTAYLFTESLNRAIRVSEKLEYGVIGLNDGGPATSQAPFGGWKESGIGREGGHHGLDHFLEIKYISVGLD
jgi:succinate-semialdehyde dehydrogenase / glutarate-semialdehyde dehydrogenase